ncbi:hypothetical protein ACMSSJ_11245 [Kerstersia gyiorum]|uniref:hypothetical protein n=1 Tax=Kerstersia gyiorum TaxID=206506 RepID=UPI0039EC2BFA
MAGWSGTRPTEFVRVVEKDLAKKRTQIATEAFQAVISGSPVDEGSFRMNNRVTINSEDHSFDASLGRGKAVEPPKGSTNVPAFESGLDIIAGEADEPYATVVIQNNAPYAGELERGTSKQAPEGVFGLAFAAVRAKHSNT